MFQHFTLRSHASGSEVLEEDESVFLIAARKNCHLSISYVPSTGRCFWHLTQITRFYFPKFLPCRKTKVCSICTRISSIFFRKSSCLFSEVIFKVPRIILYLCAVFSIVCVVWCRLYVCYSGNILSLIPRIWAACFFFFILSEVLHFSWLFGLRISPEVISPVKIFPWFQICYWIDKIYF